MVPCVAVFDIGKTNKKFLLFDQHYQLRHEEETCIPEITDDDGDPAEDLATLTEWVKLTWQWLVQNKQYAVQALNFTTYGASLVHLNKQSRPVTPLYNYLKLFPQDLETRFYETYGDKLNLAAETASPPLGMLNSGLQLYWLKYQKPGLFKQISCSLHLPQYMAYLFTGKFTNEYTSLGCHTALWNFEKQAYHPWVATENLTGIFPNLHRHDQPFLMPFREYSIPVGLGLHDSSAALIPYLKKYTQPFLLLSTGTWGITLNPFAQKPLTIADLQRDCLHYLTFDGKPVKAARQFIGNHHEAQAKRLAEHFHKGRDYYKTVQFDKSLVNDLRYLKEVNVAKHQKIRAQEKAVKSLHLRELDLSLFSSYEAAYHQLIVEMVRPQTKSVFLAAEGDITRFKTLVVDGGFSKNPVFMALLREVFPNLEIVAGQHAQGTAHGAAMIMNNWAEYKGSLPA